MEPQDAKRQTQAELDAEDRLWQSIVDGLRRQGWSKWDAYEEADLRLSRKNSTSHE